jgi:hypothetical protein
MRVFKKRMAFAAVIVLLLLSIGTSYYNYAEGWSPVDSFYFSTMTLTTIGYGDLAPTSDGAKIFTSFYAIFGIGVMLYILSSVIGVLVFRQERHFSKAFSKLGRFGMHKAHIKDIEKKLRGESKKEMSHMKKEIEKTSEKEIRELHKDFEKEKKQDIRKIEKKIKKIASGKKGSG